MTIPATIAMGSIQSFMNSIILDILNKIRCKYREINNNFVVRC